MIMALTASPGLDVECNDGTRCRYSVFFDNEDAENYEFTLQDIGSDDAVDSDVVKRSWGDLASALIVFNSSTFLAEHVDAGFVSLSLDSDGDGIENDADAFPNDGSEHADTDGDGIGNNADQDDDGDTIPDLYDSQPEIANDVDSLIHLYSIRTVTEAGECKRLVGELRDASNTALVSGNDRVVYLSGDGLSFSATNDCADTVDSISVPAGQSQFVFYIKTSVRDYLQLQINAMQTPSYQHEIQSLNNMHYVGQAYYVSTEGSDQNDGSISSPFATVTHAASQLKEGDAIFIRAGTYTYDDTTRIIIRKPDILIRNMPGEKVILEQTTFSKNNIWFVQGANSQKVTGGRVVGLELVGGYYAIKADGSDFVFSDNIVHHTGNDGIKLTYNRSASNSWNGDNTVIRNNEIYRTQESGSNGQGC